MQTPFKKYLYTFLAGFVVATALFLMLVFKGCFTGTTFVNKPYPQDSLSVAPEETTVELEAKPLSSEGIKYITLWKYGTDTVAKEVTTYVGADCKDFEQDTTVSRKQTITLIQGNKRTDYSVDEQLPFRQIVGCSVGRSLVTFGSSRSEIVIPESEPITVFKEPLITLSGFGEFDLVNDKEWRIGIELDINLGTLGIYAAPNANPVHALSLPVGATYKLWEK